MYPLYSLFKITVEGTDNKKKIHYLIREHEVFNALYQNYPYLQKSKMFNLCLKKTNQGSHYILLCYILWYATLSLYTMTVPAILSLSSADWFYVGGGIGLNRNTDFFS